MRGVFPGSMVVSCCGVILCGMAAGICSGAVGDADFYVAPDGNDAWSGRLPQRNAARSDGPFASLQRAQAAVRELRRSKTFDRPVTVVVRGGTYRLTQPLVFTPEDSGTAESPTVYAAYPGERVVLSGGVPITGWRSDSEGVWHAPLPDVFQGTGGPTQLFINGERRRRARSPDTGYYRTAGPLAPLGDRSKARGDRSKKLGFRFKPGDLHAWPDWRNMNIVLFHSWTASIHWPAALDEKKQEVRFTAPCGWPVGWWEHNQRYYIENVRAALTAPGEWLADVEKGEILYIPLPGENPETIQAEAPVCERLVEFAGEPDAGLWVEYVQLRDLVLQHAAWSLPRDKAHDGQAAVSVGAAVVLTGARHCLLEGVEITHVGTYGVWFAAGSGHNVLRKSHVHDLGAGGVKIGETWSPRNEAQAVEYNVVDNCLIHDGGHVFRAGVGVWIGRSSYNCVSHNEICDFDYTGVSVGWSWGYAASSAHHNVIEYNHIHHVGNGVLSDLGGIYTLGVSPGTVLRGNVIHDSYAYSYGGWGLYTDEGSSQIVLEKNVVWDTKSGGFHQHYGRENILRDNILAFSREDRDHYRLDYNLYWSTGDPPSFFGRTLKDWQRWSGQDRHSLVADPLFTDATRRDFRLRPGSPATGLGIEALGVDEAGLYGDARWTSKVRGLKHRDVDPAALPPRKPPLSLHTRLVQDFEETPVGRRPPGPAHVAPGQHGADVVVTDETAFSGKHALKFIDVPGQRHSWLPHLVYRPQWYEGRVKAVFAVRLEPEAVFWHEWRDAAHPYKVGPSLRVTADGNLLVGGKTLCRLPHNAWIRFTIEAVLGDGGDGSFRLVVEPKGGEKWEFAGLPCGSSDWQELDWFGFVSDAENVKTALYLDALVLERVLSDQAP